MAMQIRDATVALAAVAGVALMLIACGSDDDATGGAAGTAGTAGSGGSGAAGGVSGGGGAMSPAGKFLEDYAASVCAMYEPCCNAEGLGFDQAGCTTWFAKVTAAYWKGELDGERAAGCLDALAGARAADSDRCSTVPLFDEATLRDECGLAFRPPVREGASLGESCLLGSDCASADGGNVICYSGICLLERRGGAGDGPCVVTNDNGVPTESFRCDAEDGVYCDREANVCAPRVPGGERCPSSAACDDTALCSGGICQTLPDEGEPCLNGVPGAGGFCRSNSTCDRATLVCGPGGSLGDPCSDKAGCATGLCLDGTCVASDFPDNLNCTG
jgi:hypothetical protein